MEADPAHSDENARDALADALLEEGAGTSIRQPPVSVPARVWLNGGAAQ